MSAWVFNLLCLSLFFLVMNLTDFVKFKYIFRKSEYEDKMAFRRLYASCQRKWDNPKNIALRKEYGSFRQYFDSEFNKKFRWVSVYEEKINDIEE